MTPQNAPAKCPDKRPGERQDNAIMAMSQRDIARFNSKIRVAESGCSEWTGGLSSAGYGTFHLRKTTVLAHRVAFYWAKKSLPSIIDHICSNTICVNPAHLQPSNNRANILRGTGPTAINARKTHCPRGHLLTIKRRYRMCVECNPWAVKGGNANV